MTVRELYGRFVFPPNDQARERYEAAIQLWEEHSDDLPTSQITRDCLETFRERCSEASLAGGGFHRCWRYLRSILIAGACNGVVVPCLGLNPD